MSNRSLWTRADGQQIHPWSPAGGGGAGAASVPGAAGASDPDAKGPPHPQAPNARYSTDIVDLHAGRAHLGRTRHVALIPTPIEAGFGWLLEKTRVTYAIERDVPKPLHDAIRAAVRHWNSSLRDAGLRVHYDFNGHGAIPAGINVHRFGMQHMLEKNATGHIVSVSGDPSPTHAYTTYEAITRTPHTVSTLFNDGGLVVPNHDRTRGFLTPYGECSEQYMVGVAVHEIGHALGLDHQPGQTHAIDSVMLGTKWKIHRSWPTASDIKALKLKMVADRPTLGLEH